MCLVTRSWRTQFYALNIESGMLWRTSYKLFVLMVVTFANREIRHDGNEQHFFIY